LAMLALPEDDEILAHWAKPLDFPVWSKVHIVPEIVARIVALDNGTHLKEARPCAADVIGRVVGRFVPNREIELRTIASGSRRLLFPICFHSRRF